MVKNQDNPLQKGFEHFAKAIANLADQDIDAIIALLKKEHGPESTPDAKPLSFKPEKIDELYAYAYNLYNVGKFKEAVEIFRLMLLIDPDDPRYTLALAASFHMMKEFKNAINNYLLYAAREPDNPMPYFYLSDCYKQINDKVSMLIALEMGVKRANMPEHQVAKDRALMSIERLKSDIAKATA